MLERERISCKHTKFLFSALFLSKVEFICFVDAPSCQYFLFHHLADLKWKAKEKAKTITMELELPIPTLTIILPTTVVTETHCCKLKRFRKIECNHCHWSYFENKWKILLKIENRILAKDVPQVISWGCHFLFPYTHHFLLILSCMGNTWFFWEPRTTITTRMLFV